MGKRLHRDGKSVHISRVVLCLAIMSLILCACSIAFAEHSGKWGKLDWILNDDGELQISGKGEMEYLEDGDAWKANQDEIISVFIEDGVKSIAPKAFADCEQLSEITIPASVTDIGVWTFYGCINLSSITVSNQNSTYCSIDGVLYDKNKTLLIKCPAKTEKLKIPDSVGSIVGDAFLECKEIAEIAIPASVYSLSNIEFYYCEKLSNITVDKDNRRYCSIDGMLFNKDATVLYTCPVQKVTASLPDSLKTIEDRAFNDCERLTSVKIPDGVSVIGDYAFSRCISLKSIIIPESVTELGNSIFKGCKALETVSVPTQITHIPDGMFGDCSALNKLTINAPNISLGASALSNCASLTSIDAPIVKLGNSAINGCYKLEHIEFGDSMTPLSDIQLSFLQSLMHIVVTVEKNSAVYQQLKENDVCYLVRETGETNQGKLSLETMRGKIEYIIRTCIQTGMSDYEKALALHDWLVQNAEYDYTYTNYGADGVLLKGTGVCQSYTDAYKALLDYIGIENDKELGDNHTWNMIRLDGDWYHIDVTWDDDGNKSGYWYFGLSNEAIERIRSHKCYTKNQIATNYKYNYLYCSGSYDEFINTASIALKEGLDEGKASIQVQMPKWIFLSGEDYQYNTDADMHLPTIVLVLRDQVYSFKGRTVPMNIQYIGDYYIRANIAREEPEFICPEMMTSIVEEAFAGNPMKSVQLGEKVKTIGLRAFADCRNLEQIYIPASVTRIAEDAFSGAENLIIFGKAGSKAEEYANAHEIPFVPDAE